MPKIRYYISGHGLGHASRASQIINTLGRDYPQLQVEIVSDAPVWFFKSFLSPVVAIRSQQLDIGVVQRDSLHMDEAATLDAYRHFLPERERLVRAEAHRLREEGVALVVSDIVPLAFAAARAAGIPAVGVANFTWEWIYRDIQRRHPGYQDVLDSLAEDYRQADLYLKLPFHGEFPQEVTQRDLPLVARRASRSTQQTREILGLGQDDRVAIISFGGFGLSAFDFSPLGNLREWIFLTESALSGGAENFRVLPSGSLPYPDLVAAADVVVTKPGYGIVSEAIAHQTAVLYTSRGQFREQELLVRGLRQFARAREISNADLLNGHWGEHLEALLRQPRPSRHISTDGGEKAASYLSALASGHLDGLVRQ